MLVFSIKILYSISFISAVIGKTSGASLLHVYKTKPDDKKGEKLFSFILWWIFLYINWRKVKLSFAISGVIFIEYWKTFSLFNVRGK